MILRNNPFASKRAKSRKLAAAVALASMVPSALYARSALADGGATAAAAAAAAPSLIEYVNVGAAVAGSSISAVQAVNQETWKNPVLNALNVQLDPASVVVGDSAAVDFSVGGSFGSCDEWFDSYRCGKIRVDIKSKSKPQWKKIFKEYSRGHVGFSFTRQYTIEAWNDGDEEITLRARLRGEDNRAWFDDDDVELDPVEVSRELNIKKPFILETFVNDKKLGDANSVPDIRIKHGEFVRTKVRVARHNSPDKDGKTDTFRAVEAHGKDVALPGTTQKPEYTTLIEQMHYHGRHDCATEPVATFKLDPFQAAFRITEDKFHESREDDYVDQQETSSVTVVCECGPNETGWLHGTTDKIVDHGGTITKQPQPKPAPPTTKPAEPTEPTEPTEPDSDDDNGFDWWPFDFGMRTPYGDPYVPRQVGMYDPATGDYAALEVDADGRVVGDVWAREYFVLYVDGGDQFRDIGALVYAGSLNERTVTMRPELTPAITGRVPGAASGDVYLIPGDDELIDQAMQWQARGGSEEEMPEWLDLVPSDWLQSDGSFSLDSASRLEMGELSKASLLVVAKPPFGRRFAAGNYRLIPLDISGKEAIELAVEGFELAKPDPSPTSTLAIGRIVFTDGLSGKKLALANTKFVVRDAETEKVIATPATDKLGRFKVALPTARRVVMTVADPGSLTKIGIAAMNPLAFQLDHDLFLEEREAGQMGPEIHELAYDGRSLHLAGTTNGRPRALLVAIDGEVIRKIAADGEAFEAAIKVGRLDRSAKVQVYQVFATHVGSPATRMLDLGDKADGATTADDDPATGCSLGGAQGEGLSVLVLLGCAALLGRRRRRDA